MKLTKQNLKEALDTIEVVIDELADHPFKEEFYIIQNYEQKRILGIPYKKKMESEKIYTGLCSVCGLLKIQHDN